MPWAGPLPSEAVGWTLWANRRAAGNDARDAYRAYAWETARLQSGAREVYFGGLLVGWINTNTALIRHAGADIRGAVFAVAGPAIANRSAVTRDLPFVAGIVAIWVPVGQLLALGAGFLAFAGAYLESLFWFGVLAAGAIGVAFLANITVSPAIATLVWRPRA